MISDNEVYVVTTGNNIRRTCTRPHFLGVEVTPYFESNIVILLEILCSEKTGVPVMGDGVSGW